MATDWASEIRRVIAKWSPDQGRDESGRWSNGGGTNTGGSFNNPGKPPKTSSGKPLSMDKKPYDYRNFTPEDHKDAARLHAQEANRLDGARRVLAGGSTPSDRNEAARRQHRLQDLRADEKEHRNLSAAHETAARDKLAERAWRGLRGGKK